MFPTKNTFKAEKRLLARGNWGAEWGGEGVLEGKSWAQFNQLIS